MMRKITALVSGLLFGAGLMVSDMVNPARVLSFLDVFGAWDPTLLFVMAGAMSVSAVAWRASRKRAEAAWGGPLPPPPRQEIDARLLGGAAVFGVGWGLVGVCPGPAITATGFGGWPVLLFMASMLAGMAIYTVLNARLTGQPVRS